MKETYKYRIYIDTAERENRVVRLVMCNEQAELEVQTIAGSIDIVSSVKRLIADNGLKMSDISEFIPNLGPGSFTGLKMGVTVANIFNWWFNKRAIKDLPMPEYGMEPNINLKRNS